MQRLIARISSTRIVSLIRDALILKERKNSLSVEDDEFAYMASLDILRWLLAMTVVIHHVFGHVLEKYQTFTLVAMDGFFCLSGFLITQRLRLAQREAQKSGISPWVVLKEFYLRRVVRTWLPLCILIPSVAYIWGWEGCIVPGLFLENMKPFLPAWVPASHKQLGMLWSIAIEEHYYFGYPLIVLFCITGRSAKHFKVIALLSFVVPMILVIHWVDWSSLVNYDSSVLYSGDLFRLPALVAGCSMSYGYTWLRERPARCIEIAVLLGILLAYPVVGDVGQRSFISLPLGIGSVLLFLWLHLIKSPLLVVTRIRPLMWHAKVSYETYLYHYPIFSLVGAMGYAPGKTYTVTMLWLVGATILSWYCLQRPVQKKWHVSAIIATWAGMFVYLFYVKRMTNECELWVHENETRYTQVFGLTLLVLGLFVIFRCWSLWRQPTKSISAPLVPIPCWVSE